MLRDRRNVVLSRIAAGDKPLRREFSELEVLGFRPSYDECVAIVKKTLAAR